MREQIVKAQRNYLNDAVTHHVIDLVSLVVSQRVKFKVSDGFTDQLVSPDDIPDIAFKVARQLLLYGKGTMICFPRDPYWSMVDPLCITEKFGRIYYQRHTSEPEILDREKLISFGGGNLLTDEIVAELRQCVQDATPDSYNQIMERFDASKLGTIIIEMLESNTG